MASPYRNLPGKSFWKTGVVQRPSDFSALYSARFDINPSTRIATAGSCFAQHISAQLKRRGYHVIDAEPPPAGLPTEVSKQFGYNLYSARYGNIYSVRQLLQLIGEAFGSFAPNDVVWERNGRYFDALRPGIEPGGLASPDDVLKLRADHLRRVRQMFTQTDLLIFTMGLTEAWVRRDSGTVFPTAPETVAGHFDPDLYAFKNFSVEEVIADFKRARKLLKARNPRLRILLTVSPIPLTATASKHHVLVATVHSKAVLRAAAGALYDEFDDVDYFPSYEIIATPFLGQVFFDSSLRTVTEEGIQKVMEVFFASHDANQAGSMIAHSRSEAAQAISPIIRGTKKNEEDAVCEEALLDAFAR